MRVGYPLNHFLSFYIPNNNRMGNFPFTSWHTEVSTNTLGYTCNVSFVTLKYILLFLSCIIYYKIYSWGENNLGVFCGEIVEYWDIFVEPIYIDWFEWRDRIVFLSFRLRNILIIIKISNLSLSFNMNILYPVGTLACVLASWPYRSWTGFSLFWCLYWISLSSWLWQGSKVDMYSFAVAILNPWKTFSL